jgi:diguanylate cyclase
MRTDPKTESDGWKQKYRDAVVELDNKENRWRDDETRLHKNLLRLSFSYLGLDADLDRRLKQLQIGLKKNPDAATRAGLIEEAVDHITGFAAERDAETSAPDPAASMILLVEKLRLPDAYAKELELISSRLKREEASTVEKNAMRLADLLNETIDRREEIPDEGGSNTFIEFLSKLSFPGSLGEKVAALQKRSTEIKTGLDRLAVIDDTIALLREGLRQDAPRLNRANEAQAIVQELIDWMTLPSRVKDELNSIRSKLDDTISEEDLSVILRDLGYTVSQFHSNLMSELTDVEYYLKNIAIRLKELQLGIEDSFKDQRESLDEQEDLNSGIADQVVAIATRLVDENDLGAIKHLIDDGLSKIRSRMRDHLTRDRLRVANGEKRFQDLTDRIKRLDEESTRLRAQVQHERDRAQHDALTGVPNRAAYDERIKSEIARRNRHDRHLSLAIIDIDKFKGVNDKFGHKAGDKVLKNVADICASHIRANDFLARYGGEEFVLVLAETSLAQAHIVAEKLRTEIAGKGFYYGDHRVPITVSIGIAEFAAKETADEVFQRADRALYAGKERGRNRCVTEAEID